MTSVSNPTPNPNPGTRNAVANDDGSVTTYDENECWTTRYGGNVAWRNNNPCRLSHPCAGSIGCDSSGNAIFQDIDIGNNAFRTQMNDAPGSTIAQRINHLGQENNWGDWTQVHATMEQHGLDATQPWDGWNGSYTGTFTGGVTASDVIMHAVQDFAGILSQDATGSTTPMECPPSVGSIVSGSLPEGSLDPEESLEDSLNNSFGSL